MMRPLELVSPGSSSASEVDALKQELSNARNCYETARGDRNRLQLELSHKAAEYEALASEYEKTKQDSDQQIKQLEDALKDVQKRMFDSEGKVKQMQTHFLALKDHLTNEAAGSNSKLSEELKDQLKEMKAKYESASAEVGKLRNQLKQNELLVEEFRRDEDQLVEENKLLQKELSMLKMEREKVERLVSVSEGQLKEMAAKFADQYEHMKSSLSSEVEEKARKLEEMEKERDKLCAEAQQLRIELESQEAKFSQYVKPEEHRFMKSRCEQRSKELERAYSELKQTHQALQKETERAHAQNSLLKKQVSALQSEMQAQYVPLKVHEDVKKASDLMTQELNIKLIEITEKYNKHKAETEKLLEEKASLKETVSHFQAVYVPSEKYEEETGALKSTIADLRKQLAELGQKYEEEQAKSFELLSKNSVLNDIMKKQYVPVDTHEETKTALNSRLEKTDRELSDLKGKMECVKQKFVEANEENGALKRKLKALESQMQCEFISTEVHEKKVASLKETIQELQERNSEILSKYQINQEVVTQLHAEIEAQKSELGMIQECIKSKYAPLSSFQEREGNFEATVNKLKGQLLEQGEQLIGKEEEIEQLRQENEKLRARLQGVQNDLQQNYVLAEKSHEMERMFARKVDDLNKQLRELQQKNSEIACEKVRLLEENARHQSAALQVQNQHALLEQFEALKKTFSSTTEELKGKLSSKTASWQQELRKAQELQDELTRLKATTVPLEQHAQIKERLERDVATVKASLRDKEGEHQARREEVSKLQSEIQSTKQLLKELEGRDVVERSAHKLVTTKLEDQVRSMAEKLAELNKKFEGMCDKAAQVDMEEMPTKEEEELLQPRSFSIEQEIKDQKERCDKSLSTIAELQKRIQESAKQVEAKDNKVSWRRKHSHAGYR